LQVYTNPWQVSAAGSTDPNNLALTYSWSSNIPVNFQPNNTVANPSIQFGSGREDYTITLTVTNSAGMSSTQSFVVEYQGR
jgi:hypothetical protein